MPREELQPVLVDHDRRHGEMRPVIPEVHSVEPSERAGAMILTANGFSHNILIHLHRLQSQRPLRRHLGLDPVQRVEQADRERRARSHPGSTRQIPVVVYLKTILYPHVFQASAYRRMADLRVAHHVLDL